LPEDLELGGVTGLGLNQQELDENPRLDQNVIHDLNAEPKLPFGDGEFDAVICTVSVEYLTQPWEVFKEVLRVLKSSGIFINTFSSRWFPPKVIYIWTELHAFERMGLVLDYYQESGFTGLKTLSQRGWPRPKDDPYIEQTRVADPVFAVWGSKP
jgi:SAM-dependent methyltransferase